jgi:cytochrome c-type biogenesis protein CcmH
MNADIATLRQQLRQLQSLHGDGALSAQAYERSRGELERKLLDAVMADEPAGAVGPSASAARPSPQGPSRRVVIAAAAVVLAVAGLGYWWTGTPHPAPGTAGALQAAAPLAASPEAPASTPHALSFEQIGDMAGRLAERLKQNPRDAQGWAMLARSYTVLGRRAEAVAAYAKAVALNGQDASLLADYADAIAVTRDSRLAGEPLALIERALKLDPDHLKALSLAGTESFERKDYRAAVARWERILQVAPPGSAYVDQVRGSIVQARELGGLPAAAAGSAAAAAPGASLGAR